MRVTLTRLLRDMTLHVNFYRHTGRRYDCVTSVETEAVPPLRQIGVTQRPPAVLHVPPDVIQYGVITLGTGACVGVRTKRTYR